MSEHPIIFSTKIVKAILEGRKTQTRRVVKSPKWSTPNRAGVDFGCPYGQVGSKLWVKETCILPRDYSHDVFGVHYKTSDIRPLKGWKSPIHMPRWASHITLEITDVRVERLQEISGKECLAEGTEPDCVYPRKVFEVLWNSIHKKEHRWEQNPFVWVITFKKLSNTA